MDLQLRYSGENYLKAILLLHQTQNEVRQVDIAARLHFSKASVSIMMKNLEQQGYVSMVENNVCLTDKGLKVANGVYDRFSTIQDFLTEILGITPENASRDAGAMEHVISNETFEALRKLLQMKGSGKINDFFSR